MDRLRLFTRIALALALPHAALAVGCSESHVTGDDSGITIMLDGGPPRPDGSGPPVPACGNGRLEAGEQCDDANLVPGDGCDGVCVREPYCGDGTVTAPEVCDDSNNRSADGCRSDCLSNEICGNGIIDYATGEICDSTTGCGTDCRSVPGCGDGTVAAPETCDDGNASRWDGCGSDCRDEITLAVEGLEFGAPSVGCDYSGDGMPDNKFSSGLRTARDFLNMFLTGGGGGGGVPTFLMSFMGLDDPTGASDPDLRVAWMSGEMGSAPGTYLVDPATLIDGNPATSLQGSITARDLDAGPEDIDLPIGFLPLTLQQGRVQGTTAATAGELSSIGDGLLCGVVGPDLLLLVDADTLESLGGGGGFEIDIGDPCDGSLEPATLFDMMVGGARLVVFMIGNVAPDVDLDGDGLESYEVTRTGPDGCQPVITACIDGDGTRIEGRDCIRNPGFVDGYSAGLTYTATRAEIVGVSGGGTPPPTPAP